MAIYARLENGTYAEVTGVYKTDGTEVSEIFQGDRLVYSASNEIYGALPLYYNGKGYDLTDYLISGNAVRDGTPSADAPVDAQGSGVRTGNLFDADASDADKGYVYNEYLRSNGETTSSPGWRISEYIEISESALYTIFYNGSYNAPSVCFYDNDKGFISGSAYSGKAAVTIESPTGTKYCRFSFRDTAKERIMLNLGSTALPYEPYGYKLPLTVNGVEYPIYLGTVPTTRRIKKLVLTGEENWSEGTDNYYVFINFSGRGAGIPLSTALCTHTQGGVYVNNTGRALFFKKSVFVHSSLADFKSYLSAQYANGTPVTVWYPLAEPETGIVNEPLMKIGDYADTVSFAQAGVTIPTVNGANVLDMASSVKPSEMYIKGKGIKPTGYGQLVDKNSVCILDKNDVCILVHGQ